MAASDMDTLFKWEAAELNEENGEEKLENHQKSHKIF